MVLHDVRGGKQVSSYFGPVVRGYRAVTVTVLYRWLLYVWRAEVANLKSLKRPLFKSKARGFEQILCGDYLRFLKMPKTR
jgi:hypothetical protein